MRKETFINSWHKWRHFEYWPFQIFYFPMFLYGLWLAMRSGSLSYFSAANPGLKYGGAFDMSKSALLAQIDPVFQPAFIIIKNPEQFSRKDEEEVMNRLGYPLVAKPDVGERGKRVEKIRNPHELIVYMSETSGPVLLQEFAPQPQEAGILFYRMPDGTEKGITSIVLREFLKVTGNGKYSLEELAGMQERARNRMDYLKKRFKESWEQIIPEGETIILEPIGNHNRGTAFLDGNHLITPELVNKIDEMTEKIKGFYYGRLDVKFETDEQLKRGKDLVVLEVNGVNSEPAHIYQPGTHLCSAYKEIVKHMKLIREIALMNHKHYGVKYAPVYRMVHDLLLHGRHFQK